LPVTDRCSPTHAFIRLLQDKQKLLTNYTQNIDNIEAYAGIEPERLIQCHGSWATASCRKCHTEVQGDVIFEDVRQQRVSFCQTCLDIIEKQPRKRKRTSNGKSKSRSSHSDSEDDGRYDVPQPGVMKVSLDLFLRIVHQLTCLAQHHLLRRKASRPLLRQTNRARRRHSRPNNRHRYIHESRPCL
jgi:NAD-dependent histone deacetylase SIR2